MSAIEIEGMCPMKGEIEVQGSKNAVLPMMAAAVLNPGITVIENVPGIQDVFCMMGILHTLGCRCSLTGRRLSIDASGLKSCHVRQEDMEKMRSSILLLGALLGRTGEADTYGPGGCRIGARPIDLHLMALEKLGASFQGDEHRLHGEASCLQGERIIFPYPSVGATENALLAAAAARGQTVLEGCAREPEVAQLAKLLNAMGARIQGAGGNVILVEGGHPLHGARIRADGDRIAAGTYLLAAAGTGGEVLLTGAPGTSLGAVCTVLRRMGAQVCEEEDFLYLRCRRRLRAASVITGPYPGFPTDLQSEMTALLAVADGESRVVETVFENRLGAAAELRKLGACIRTEGREIRISGRRKLTGGTVSAADLRGAAALTAAGLWAEGKTVVEHCDYILRGYEDICRDLCGAGCRVRRIPDGESRT